MTMQQAYDSYTHKLAESHVRGHAPVVDQVGFTAPARIWAKVDDIERSAASLDRDIDANVRNNPAFVAGWKTWYQNWRRNYYDRYRASTLDGVRNRLSALSGSDALDAAVERERVQLHSFFENYSRQTLPNGQPVPYPSGLPPVRQGSDPDHSPAWSLPWWFWLAAGGALAFIGWRFYVTYKAASARGRVIEDRFLPAVAERYGLPGAETREVLQAGRDWEVPQLVSYELSGRDRSTPPPSPLDLSYYAEFDGARDGGGRSVHADFEVSSDEAPNFAYDPSRDPLRDRFR